MFEYLFCVTSVNQDFYSTVHLKSATFSQNKAFMAFHTFKLKFKTNPDNRMYYNTIVVQRTHLIKVRC